MSIGPTSTSVAPRLATIVASAADRRVIHGERVRPGISCQSVGDAFEMHAWYDEWLARCVRTARHGIGRWMRA